MFLTASVNLPVGTFPDWDSKNFKDRPQIFLYYANDVAPNAWGTENKKTMMKWMEETHTGYGDMVMKRLQDDEATFGAVVAKEITAIKSGLLGTELGRTSGAVIITNTLAHAGKILVIAPHSSEVTEEALFKYVPSDDPRLKSYPLMDVKFFEAFLLFAKNRFKDTDPLYSMVVKSHGGTDFALTQLATLRANVMKKKDFQDEIYFQERAKSGQNDQLSSPRTKLDEQAGLTKSDFFRVISTEQTAPHFTVLFLESCKSGFGLVSIGELPKTVDLLYTSNQKGLEYKTIKYDQVFALADHQNFAKGLASYLQNLASPKGQDEFSDADWKKWAYSVPLILLIVISWARRRRRSNKL